tara:strand:+ start:1954 stop:2964 length:1011 start_codon:yes stop_codon:yes gene_type:complete
MSSSYYERKMVGGYIYIAGRYRKITGIRYTEGYNNNPPARRLNYPEEYLPHILFQVGDDVVVWDDFEIKFPEERYAKINKRVVYGSRTMSQAYQIVPNPSNYNLSDDNCRFADWLNAASDKFDPKEDILNWDKDALFSDRLMARTNGNNRFVEYCGQTVMVLRREGERQLGKVTAELLVRKLTKEIDLWPTLTGNAVVEGSSDEAREGMMPYQGVQRLPFPSPRESAHQHAIGRLREYAIPALALAAQRTEPTDNIEGLNFRWVFKPENNLTHNWEYSYRKTRTTTGGETLTLYFRMRVCDYQASTLDEILNLRENIGGLGTSDMLKIFTHLRENS